MVNTELERMSTALHKMRARVLLDNLFSLRPSRWKSSQVMKEALRDTLDDEATLYVHWPYCARRCTYCNFNKYISKSVEHTRMADCLAKETSTLLQLSGVSRVKSIFFGGGTPSLALPSTVGKVIDTVADHVTFTEGSEVTLEANPTHLAIGKLKDFQHVGVNRLSVGVQALNTEDLKLLGRDHSVTEALRCVEAAKCVFPEHVSVDLMFGRPGQSVEAWRKELHQVIDMDVNHVSLYQLTVERGTQLFKWVDSGHVTVPDNDTMADMYIAAVELLEAHGLERYEVSNFAKQGSESKHNQAYWQGSQYIGVGPGAHGRFIPVTKQQANNGQHGREARIQTLEPDNWMFEVEKFGHATRKIISQSTKVRLEELLCLGLRTREGVTNVNWSKVIDISYLQSFGSSERCQQFVEEGLLRFEQSGVRATSKGLLILDTILPHLLYELGQLCDNEGVT
ncbi:radical S-adenosyl methionine domain-containing protein 1, mitochondrial-like [Mercenaria mercenaria]|uniref:radical S-adenosyl methionine domain-containing protein 1, mitochondrial-like n=1 Tax=Mercenaria mercenaria TaxID=6596 RepID=UPI00234E5C05|nr:radical S-adenosyl methionine domain-containing protein 1, mitochondrial-like [Mercenaria mercenaria]XP_053391656.1 radical S-adenosyl methionine domain-containing protein 1, mitochondrial-like [Mercenaria mercenaria]XP_053391662.1 radical S-adenosyl methionine domain-containing protein 1, mitochondrial-like [Mercenaria mercenaria]